MSDQNLQDAIERWWQRLSQEQRRAHVLWVGEHHEYLQAEKRRARDLQKKEPSCLSK